MRSGRDVGEIGHQQDGRFDQQRFEKVRRQPQSHRYIKINSTPSSRIFGKWRLHLAGLCTHKSTSRWRTTNLIQPKQLAARRSIRKDASTKKSNVAFRLCNPLYNRLFNRLYLRLLYAAGCTIGCTTDANQPVSCQSFTSARLHGINP
jgi:hypothetical protein